MRAAQQRPIRPKNVPALLHVVDLRNSANARLISVETDADVVLAKGRLGNVRSVVASIISVHNVPPPTLPRPSQLPPPLDQESHAGWMKPGWIRNILARSNVLPLAPNQEQLEIIAASRDLKLNDTNMPSLEDLTISQGQYDYVGNVQRALMSSAQCKDYADVLFQVEHILLGEVKNLLGETKRRLQEKKKYVLAKNKRDSAATGAGNTQVAEGRAKKESRSKLSTKKETAHNGSAEKNDCGVDIPLFV
jgi:hypothetical protein